MAQSQGQGLSTNTFGTAKWIVAPSTTPWLGTHTTLQSALTSASSGDTIFIRTGSYTESNIELKPGVNITAFPGDGVGNVNFTPSSSTNPLFKLTTASNVDGNINISNLNLVTNGNNILNVSNSSVNKNVITFNNCNISTQFDGAIVSTNTNSSSAIKFFRCDLDITAASKKFFSTAGSIQFYYCNLYNSGSSTTANICSGSGSVSCVILYCDVYQVFDNSSGSGQFFSCKYTHFAGSSIAATALVMGGNSGNNLNHCTISSGSQIAISIASGTTLTIERLTIDSSVSGGVAITGSGNLTGDAITFIGSANKISTSLVVTPGYYAPYLRSVTQPAFNANCAVGLTNKTGDGITTYQIVFGTVNFDQTGSYNNTTGVFTAPVTGKYQFNVSLVIGNLSASFNEGVLTLVTTSASYTFYTPSPNKCFDTNLNMGFSMSMIVNMTANDTAYCTIIVYGGTKTVGVANTSYFSGFLVC